MFLKGLDTRKNIRSIFKKSGKKLPKVDLSDFFALFGIWFWIRLRESTEIRLTNCASKRVRDGTPGRGFKKRRKLPDLDEDSILVEIKATTMLPVTSINSESLWKLYQFAYVRYAVNWLSF